MAEKRRGLGRGLGALISSGPVDAAAPAPTSAQADESASENSAPTSARKATQGKGAAKTPAKKSPAAGKSTSRTSSAGQVKSAAKSSEANKATSKPSAASTKSRSVTKGSTAKTAASTSAPASSKSKATSKASTSEGTSQDEASQSTPARRTATQRTTSTGARRGVRPVDMFFTPTANHSAAAANGTEPEPAGRSTSATRTADRPKPRRAVPDVLGRTRRAQEAEVQDPSEDTAETVGSTELAPRHAANAAAASARSNNSAPADTDAALTDINEASEDVQADTETQEAQAAQENSAQPEEATQGNVSADLDADGPELVQVPGASFAEVSLGDIHPNRKQPRQVFDPDELEELVQSIQQVGLLQPIVVRPSRETGDRKYELVMGERRWRAAQQAKLDAIPAIIRDTDDGDLLRDALLENLHRSQLNPLEEAAAYQQLMTEFGCTQEELSVRIGRSRPQISNTIRLMRLPALVQRRVAAGVLTAGHARALLTLEDPADMEKLAQRIVNEGLSVRATEEAAAVMAGAAPTASRRRRAEPQRHERLDFLANTLQDRLDTNVKITLGARKGKVQIDFASVDDLDRIMSLINPND